MKIKKRNDIHDSKLNKKKNTIFDTLRWLPIYGKTFLVDEVYYRFYVFKFWLNIKNIKNVNTTDNFFIYIQL